MKKKTLLIVIGVVVLALVAGGVALALNLTSRAATPAATAAPPKSATDILPPQPVPTLVTIDQTGIAASWQKVKSGDSATLDLVGQLRTAADQALGERVRTVVEKAKNLDKLKRDLGLPSNFDPHNYLSGRVYEAPQSGVQVEDKANLAGDASSSKRRAGLLTDVNTLSTAYYLTGHQAYAQKTADWLRAWFTDPATRMLPNLTYAEYQPSNPVEAGVIDGHNLPQVLDAVSLISNSGALNSAEQAQIKQWFADYLNWLTTSAQGKHEGDLKVYPNNRGTWYRAQVAAIAAYLGQTDLARSTAGQGRQLIDHQIAPDGTQPIELARGEREQDPWNYSYFNLLGLTRLGLIGRVTDVNLFNYPSTGDSRMQKALDLLLPYALKAKPWPGDLQYKDPATGQLRSVKQASAPNFALLNLPATILARIYTGDTGLQDHLGQLKPLVVSRLQFPVPIG